MKIALALSVVLVVINQWDQNYNNGVVTRAGFALARHLAQSFGL